MPQKQTFTDVTPIQSGSQTFSDVTPIEGSSESTPPRGFLSGLYDSVAGGAKALAHSFTDKPTNGTFFDQTLDAQKAEGSKAVDNAKQGRYSEAAGHGLAAVVPGFGPAAAKAGEDIGSGNTGYGLGEAAGLIGQAAAPGLAEKVPGGRILRTAGKVAKGVAEDIPVVRQAGKLSQYWKETAPEPAAPSFPGAPEPATPPQELTQASALYRGSSSPPDPAAGLGTIPVRGSIAGQMVDSVAKPQTSTPMQRGSLSQMMNQLQDQVGKGLGASPPPNPTKPIYQRGGLSSAMEGASDVPQGHTAVQSSALKSYKYDPEANEFHAKYGSGGDTVHVFGDVSPDEAQAFEQAQSKGQAMQQIKSGHPLVAKIINGKRQPVKAAQ